LALTVGCPVIPVAMVGTREAWPPGKALRPLRRARIVVGCPLRLEGSASDAAHCRRETNRVMEAIRALSGQAVAEGFADAR
ncbi:MAG: 1-acyl-sn-glycerol-3-phosphate acyltransferase, partial [Thermoplasmatota archaeon]